MKQLFSAILCGQVRQDLTQQEVLDERRSPERNTTFRSGDGAQNSADRANLNRDISKPKAAYER